jgi:UDP-2,3-diacylglucosamine hydrolase
MIHGHTHRPAIHEWMLDGQPARRAVLGDWYDQGSVLRCDAAGWRLEPLPLPGI